MVNLIVYDFDGVLTDNRVWVNEDGVEWVACNRSDGWWIGEIRKLGIPQIILSTETNKVVSARASKLKLEAVQGVADKHKALLEIAHAHNYELKKTIYIGNDMNDFQCLKAVGFPMCPQDSHPEILKICKKVIPVHGGTGVVRHIYDYLMENSPQ